MSTLLNVYSYNDLIRDKLYALKFNCLPSKITITTIVDKELEISAILRDIHFLIESLQVYSKNLEAKEADQLILNEYLLIQSELKIFVWISLYEDRLLIELLFHIESEESEKLANDSFKFLQEKYLKKKDSKINLLSRDIQGNFQLEPL